MFVLIFFFCRTMFDYRTCVGNILKAMRGIVVEHAGHQNCLNSTLVKRRFYFWGSNVYSIFNGSETNIDFVSMFICQSHNNLEHCLCCYVCLSVKKRMANCQWITMTVDSLLRIICFRAFYIKKTTENKHF
jgi:hypothetical protein